MFDFASPRTHALKHSFVASIIAFAVRATFKGVVVRV